MLPSFCLSLAFLAVLTGQSQAERDHRSLLQRPPREIRFLPGPPGPLGPPGPDGRRGREGGDIAMKAKGESIAASPAAAEELEELAFALGPQAIDDLNSDLEEDLRNSQKELAKKNAGATGATGATGKAGGSPGAPGKTGRPGLPGEPGSPSGSEVTGANLLNRQEVDFKSCKTIMKTLESKKFKIFGTLAKNAGLHAAFNDLDTMLTVFAPTDDAFLKFFKRNGIDPDMVLNSFDFASKIILYHAIPRGIPSVAFADGQVLSSLLEESDSPCGVGNMSIKTGWVPVNGGELDGPVVEKGVTVQGGASSSRILEKDVRACLSVVHVMEDVLLPCPTSDFLGTTAKPDLVPMVG